MSLTGNKTERLTLELRKRIALMDDGAPFPTVRQLIREYGVSQPVVVAALARLKELKLLTAHVGRGSFVSKKEIGRKRILLLQPDWPGESIRAVIPEVRRGVEAAGCEFRHETYDYKLDTPPSFADYRADLIVLDSPTGPQLAPENIESIVRSPVPVIFCRNEIPVQGLNYICEDNYATGVGAASYLHQMGHRKIALLYSEPRSQGRSLAFRQRGFETVAAIHKMTIEEFDCKIRPGEKADRAIDEFAKKIRSGEFDFTAVFVISHSGAKYLAARLAEYGVEVPKTVSIVTGGNFPLVETVTTFASEAVAYTRAITELVERLLNRSGGETQLSLPVSLFDHQSVANLNLK